MEPLLNHLLIPLLIAMFLAINMGASGTAPSFSVAYGANVIDKKYIPSLFGFMVFIGAIAGGKATSTTIGKELLSPEIMTFSLVSIVLFSISISLLVANLLGVPQSTSQSTVLSITAVAIYYSELNTKKLLFEIIPVWFILPIISFLICFLIGKYIYHPLRKKGYTISSKVNNNPILKTGILLASMYVAFSIGVNNVANAAGPISTMTINELGLDLNGVHFNIIMILSTLIIAPSFGIGSSLLGSKVLKNTGKEIILFGRIEAIIIAIVSATLLVLVSITKGIPTSLVQLNVGAILGIGVAKLGFKNIFKKTEVHKFFAVWIIAPAISFGLSLLLVFIADKFNLL